MIRQLFNSLSFHSNSPKKLSYNFIIHIRDLSIIFLTKVLVFAIFWRNMAGKFENYSPIVQFSFVPFQLSYNFIIQVRLKDHFPNKGASICNFLTKHATIRGIYGGKIWKWFANCSILFRSIPTHNLFISYLTFYNTFLIHFILQFYNTRSFERWFFLTKVLVFVIFWRVKYGGKIWKRFANSLSFNSSP